MGLFRVERISFNLVNESVLSYSSRRLDEGLLLTTFSTIFSFVVFGNLYCISFCRLLLFISSFRYFKVVLFALRHYKRGFVEMRRGRGTKK